MKRYTTCRRVLMACLAGALLACCPATGPAWGQEDQIVRRYAVDVTVFAYDPNDPLGSYRSGPKTSLSAGSGVSQPFADETRSFRVSLRGKHQQDQFRIAIEVDPDSTDQRTAQRSFEVDLSDLKARQVELARNPDGRVYAMNLSPSVEVIDNRPQRLTEEAFGFTRWTFDGSIVIFNDTVYAGRMHVAGGPKAFVEYPGVAKVEFALRPFRGAKPIGTLIDGRLHIQTDDWQNVEIFDVKNGYHSLTLPGGPYQVWARWTPVPEGQPVEMPSKEEWIRLAKRQIAEAGNTVPPQEKLEAWYENARQRTAKAMVCGVSQFTSEERLND